MCVSARERCGAVAAQGRPKARLSSVPSKMHFRQVAGVFEKMPQLKLEEQRPTLSRRFRQACVGCVYGTAKVRLACPLAAQCPQYGPDQPRQREGGSTQHKRPHGHPLRCCSSACEALPVEIRVVTIGCTCMEQSGGWSLREGSFTPPAPCFTLYIQYKQLLSPKKDFFPGEWCFGRMIALIRKGDDTTTSERN